MYLARVLENNGAANWTSGRIHCSGGTINNNGSFTASSTNVNYSLDAQGNTSGATNVFNNAGTFIKTGGYAAAFNTWYSGVAFNNTGYIDVNAGSLRACTELSRC